MPKIILSYRRSDSDAIAGRIRDNLALYYGNESVFIDVDNIPFDIDFREHIRKAFGEHDLMLAIVGNKWTGARKGGRTRIQEETDPVRVEVEMALERRMPLIPVLVEGARMPKAEELPESLKDFSFRNAAEIESGRDFRQHMDRLIRSIDKTLGLKPRSETRGVGALPEREGCCGDRGDFGRDYCYRRDRDRVTEAARRRWRSRAAAGARCHIGGAARDRRRIYSRPCGKGAGRRAALSARVRYFRQKFGACGIGDRVGQ